MLLLFFYTFSPSEKIKVLNVVLEERYNMKVSLITAASASDRTVVPVPVQMSILLLNIFKMTEVEHMLDLQFQITLQWFENRAIFYNLKIEVEVSYGLYCWQRLKHF